MFLFHDVTPAAAVFAFNVCAGTFSGNGVYSQDQVRSIVELGHQVFVISAKPKAHQFPPKTHGATKLIEIPVSTWGRLDFESPWKEFSSKIDSKVFYQVLDFSPEVIIAVDWSAYPVYERLKAQYISTQKTAPPLVWNVYRIFTRTADASSLEYVKSIESESFAEAAASIVLARTDYEYILEALVKRRTFRVPFIVFPHIRRGVVKVPMLLNSMKSYISCCVRLSEEKEPQRFVEIVEEMEKRDLFRKFNVTPLMCGSIKSHFAQGLKDRVRRAVPESVIPEEFLGPEKLAYIFSRTKLNIHPCLYDAYGMTVIEAASQGTPSLVQTGGSVGAADFLRSNHSELFEVDYNQGIPATVDLIQELLTNDKDLQFVGEKASIRARSYTARDNAEEVIKILTRVIEQHHVDLRNRSPNSSFHRTRKMQSFSTHYIL